MSSRKNVWEPKRLRSGKTELLHQSYAPVLTAWKEFEPYEVVATTYQAISGAGKTFKDWPEMEGNIIPYIGGEEEKSEQEPLRLWGEIKDGEIVKASEPVITCQCIRVPVLDGHTAAVFVKFRKKPTKEQLIEKLVNFKGLPQELELRAHRSSSFSIWKRIIVRRYSWMSTMRRAWVYLLAVREKTKFTIGSL